MGREDRATWKANYFLKLVHLLEEYPRCFIVGVDNVRSKQMQQIRQSLRGDAELLMGKNTMIRKALRGYMDKNPDVEKLMPHIKGNIGFVFTNCDLAEIRDKILDNRVEAPAKAGAIAPVDVYMDAHNTMLGPEKTAFFQALSIPTKISRGTIEILNRIHLIKKDEKVGASEATLLGMLKMYPFTYGLEITQVYDSGTCFDPAILDITTDDVRNRFMMGVSNVAAVSLQIGYPTMVSAPHSIANGFKNLMAISIATDYTFKEAEHMKELLSDPEKLAAMTAAAAATAVSTDAAAPGDGGGGAAADGGKGGDDDGGSDSDSDGGGFGGLFD